VELGAGGNSEEAAMGAFADKYFAQFRRTPFGMMRLDPQDAGPGYRNVIGLSGGISSPLFKILQVRCPIQTPFIVCCLSLRVPFRCSLPCIVRSLSLQVSKGGKVQNINEIR
jgi:hypothetical protein